MVKYTKHSHTWTVRHRQWSHQECHGYRKFSDLIMNYNGGYPTLLVRKTWASIQNREGCDRKGTNCKPSWDYQYTSVPIINQPTAGYIPKGLATQISSYHQMKRSYTKPRTKYLICVSFQRHRSAPLQISCYTPGLHTISQPCFSDHSRIWWPSFVLKRLLQMFTELWFQL